MEDKQIVDLYWQRSDLAYRKQIGSMGDTAIPLPIISAGQTRMRKNVSMTPGFVPGI